MTRARGFTLLETVFALGLSILVLLAVEMMFVDSLRFRVHSDQLIARNVETQIIDSSLREDVDETNLRLATVIAAPSADQTGPPRSLSAIALPRARDAQTNRFVIDPKRCTPVWQTLRVTYLQPSQTVLKEVDVRPADGAPVTAAVDGATLAALCAHDGLGVRGWERLAKPKVLSRTIERFAPTIVTQSTRYSDGEPIDTYSLEVEIRRADVRQEGGPVARTSTARVYASANSLYPDPGPLKSPLPVPVPLVTIDGSRLEW